MNSRDQHRLDYLNLEIRSYKERRTIDDVQMYCFSKDQSHKHKFHSENTHLNTISDLLYSALFNLRTLHSSVLFTTDIIFVRQKTQKENFIQLEEKLEYIQKALVDRSSTSSSKQYKEIIQRLEKLEKLLLS